jgi:hypothetical protein
MPNVLVAAITGDLSKTNEIFRILQNSSVFVIAGEKVVLGRLSWLCCELLGYALIRK